jgi:hypothetical protein
MMVPGSLRPCDYFTDGRNGAIVVYVNRTGARTFFARRGAGRNASPLRGLGDEAFQEGFASVFVRLGDGYFSIGTQKGAGRSGMSDLRRLATAALTNLGRA